LSAGGSTPTTTSMDQSLLKSGISLSWLSCTCFFSPECSAFQFVLFHLINILHHIMFVHLIVCRELHSNNLDGPIPPEIGNLVKLTWLYVLLLSRMQCFHICVVPLDCGQVKTRFPPSYLKCLYVWIISGITFCITLCLSTKLCAGTSPTTTNSMDQSLLKSGILWSWLGCTCFFSPECSAFQFVLFHLIVDKWKLVFHPLIWSVCMCGSYLE
jgi:hypothetical protein